MLNKIFAKKDSLETFEDNPGCCVLIDNKEEMMTCKIVINSRILK